MSADERNTMKPSLRIALMSFATLLATAALTVSAVAAVDSFLRFNATGPNNDGTLTTNFKLAGLGGKTTVTLTASADATAVYICLNKGGNFPSDPKKQVLAGPVSASEQLTSDKNGQITASLSLSPPATTLECPSGQHPALAYVSYKNVAISEPDGPTESISFNFEKLYIDYQG
jgi:hypothetical protein